MTKVAVVTSTRADYGLLSVLLHRIHNDPALELQLLVAGMHLLPEYGDTWREIESEGLVITRKVSLYSDEDIKHGLSSRYTSVKAVARGLLAFGEVFTDLKPDLLLVLGDRFEMLAATQAALLLDIPIAHIHGGEVTEGALDEAVRHAITKMASLHFVATERYRQRVIQLGEPPHSVFNVGAPGLEPLIGQELLNRQTLEQHLGFTLRSPCLLITYHPETRGSLSAEAQIACVLGALEQLTEMFCLFTAPNIDVGGEAVLAAIKQFQAKHADRAMFIESLGRKRYLSALKYVDAVVGNSSSGIIEVPSFGIPTVNIGDRQKGREKAPSIMDVSCETQSIAAAIRCAVSRERDKAPVNPYIGGPTSALIVERLKQFDTTAGCRKVFYDLPSAVFCGSEVDHV